MEYTEVKMPIHIMQVSNGWEILTVRRYDNPEASQVLAVFNKMNEMLEWIEKYYNEPTPVSKKVVSEKVS